MCIVYHSSILFSVCSGVIIDGLLMCTGQCVNHKSTCLSPAMVEVVLAVFFLPSIFFHPSLPMYKGNLCDSEAQTLGEPLQTFVHLSHYNTLLSKTSVYGRVLKFNLSDTKCIQTFIVLFVCVNHELVCKEKDNEGNVSS